MSSTRSTPLSRSVCSSSADLPAMVENDYDKHGHLVDVFRRTADAQPNAVVVVSEEYPPWTIRDLDRITDQLAVHFRENFDAGKGKSIGIFMRKTPEYVISYIAALKAGGVITP